MSPRDSDRPRDGLSENRQDQREMRSGVVMILEIARQHAAQVTLTEDNDVIPAFTADRTDQSLDIWVLPGRSRGSNDLRDAHRANAMPESGAIRFVPVEPSRFQDIPGLSGRIETRAARRISMI